MQKIAFLFAGQGAQHAGMGMDLCEGCDTIKNIFEEANEHLKIDLYQICSSEKQLEKTNNVQTAVFVISYAIYKILEENNDF